MREKITFILNAEEVQLLWACYVFEPGLKEQLCLAEAQQRRGRFVLVLESGETTNILNALGALSDDATEMNQPDKAIAFAVLYDKLKDVSRTWDRVCVCEDVARESNRRLAELGGTETALRSVSRRKSK